ncbi:putative Coiled-coil domain-containing protein [Helianthus annuus]|uniref:Coiled-coil domain-containing protein n=1 Tax=Helianthus annuus TaxID=4232 RepID=A0A251T9G1_HELAN|nr:coiled-coil domain-containing protein 22 homolog [Helianthus annuus]KAF5781292.1 putative Coiled-coil domain-containing protein [Helianthus annuus]KAJ0500922.1 putative Coiled-coil domain-containing protein [Helianthus annuus]KAJ0508572.1 putative Coiled-coil domain-containing protein [Helianthus annuus]KAJ0516813.1 putative Coiled-coil domain-containing protein [Helianthus annuus]KAJ0684818.1 putative Coiled-coil domain-containing protein [Helianthus annuus]
MSVSVSNRGERSMEESHEILLNSLSKAGVPIPPEVSSVQDLTPEALVSICAHSLRIISNSDSFPITLPESMADRFTVCTDLASSVKDLGYIGDMSFHKFLYPSEEDMYKLIRFLVGRLSESSRTAVSPETEDDNATTTTHVDILERSVNDADDRQDLHTKVEDLKLRTDDVASHTIQYAEDVVTENGNRREDSDTNNAILIEDARCSRNSVGGKVEVISQEDGQHKRERSMSPLQDKSSQESVRTSDKTEILINQENVFTDEMKAKSLMLQQLEEQHDMLKAAMEMACDEHTPLESYITQLSKQIDAKKHNIAEMESKWETIIKPLKDEKRNFEEDLCAKQPESQEKHQQWKKLEQDLESTLSETNQREKELLNLKEEIEKLPKSASRRSYIERIKEITKNSRKQDIDIERILKDTRDLQLESNMIQERLHRTYAVVDETLLREAKKDQVGEQAHILLTTIHESFQEISEKILAADRTRREETDLETKLSSIATRSLNMDKLQVDLDAIRKENEYLESRLGNP